MAARPTTDNFDPRNLKERTTLAADAAAGATSITLESADGLAVGDFIYLGEPATEQTQKARITNLVGAVATLAVGLTYAAREDTSVRAVLGDRARFYRAAALSGGGAPADGAFSVVATVDLDPESPQTGYYDSGGGSGFFYKVTYVHSVSSAETPIAEAPVINGTTSHYVTLPEVRKEAGFQGVDQLNESIIESVRESAESEIDGYLAQAGYALPLPVVPGMVRQIAKELAAGFLLNQEFGLSTTGGDNPGDSRIERAEKNLTKIQTNDLALVDPYTKQVITPAGDEAGAEPSGAGRVDGYPDSDPDATTGEPVRAFTRGDEY